MTQDEADKIACVIATYEPTSFDMCDRLNNAGLGFHFECVPDERIWLTEDGAVDQGPPPAGVSKFDYEWDNGLSSFDKVIAVPAP